jgi:C4-dicarboxylate transporter DctM subunit
MNEVMAGLIGLVLVLALFFTGIELGFAMAVVGFLGFSYVVSLKAGLNLLAKDSFEVLSSYGFTVIPLFIFMGQIAFNAGIAKRLYETAYKFIGHIPGGLAMATVGGATAFKAICGSSPATAATFASVAVPEMDRYGYSKKLSTGDSHAPQRDAHRLRDYHRTIDRQAVPGGFDPRADHRFLLYPDHLGMVPDQSRPRAQG